MFLNIGISCLSASQPNFSFDLTMESLKQDPKGILPSGRWSAFEKDPKDDQKDKNAIFLPMADIFNKVVDAIIGNSELATDTVLVQFLHKPAKPRMSRTEKNATRPHACLMLKQRLQDARKCILSMHYIMRNNPCR